jgi:hypothetical protein
MCIDDRRNFEQPDEPAVSPACARICVAVIMIVTACCSATVPHVNADLSPLSSHQSIVASQTIPNSKELDMYLSMITGAPWPKGESSTAAGGCWHGILHLHRGKNVKHPFVQCEHVAETDRERNVSHQLTVGVQHCLRVTAALACVRGGGRVSQCNAC